MKYYSSIFLLLLFFSLSRNVAISQESNCDPKLFRQLDFWIGDWEVKNKVNGLKLGDNFIHRIEDNSFIIQENWTGLVSDKSTGLHYYDPSIKKWRHRRIDQVGNTIDFTGIVKNDTAFYHGISTHNKSYATINHRITITKIAITEMHYLWEQSVNNGPWNVVFNGQYIRKKKAPVKKNWNDLYESFTESLQSYNQQKLSSLFTEDAILNFPDEKIIINEKGISDFLTLFFENLKKQGVEKCEFSFDLTHSQEINPVYLHSGYYYYFYENEEGRETLNAGTFHAVLVSSDEGKYKFQTLTLNKAISKKLIQSIFLSAY